MPLPSPLSKLLAGAALVALAITMGLGDFAPTAALAQGTDAAEIAPPAPFGEEGFALTSAPAGERAYQVALGADGLAFVTSARGKTVESAITVLDAATLADMGGFDIATDDKGRVINVFGIAVDDVHGRVWTTNTLDDTVSVYDIATRAPVKVFERGTVKKPRDIVIDAARGRAYVNAELSGRIHVFDTDTLLPAGTLDFPPDADGRPFATLNLDLDAGHGRLHAVSRNTPRVGVIDLATGAATTADVPGLESGMGIAHDGASGRVFVADLARGSILTLDATGGIINETDIGTGALSMAFAPASGLLFAASRTSGTVFVLNGDGALVANLPGGALPNHVVAGPDGAVYLVAMAGTADDDDDRGALFRITRAP